MTRSLAVLFAKPHVSRCEELFSIFRNLIEQLDIEVVAFRNAILDGDILYRNYLPHAFFAFEPFSAHLAHLPQSANHAIEQYTGLSVAAHLANRSLLSAAEAVECLKLQPVQLYAAWEQSERLARVQLGYQIKCISLSCSSPVWVVNGYFPYRFDLYKEGSETVPAWLLALPCGTSVGIVRAKLVGDSLGPENTLRGYLSKHHARLGIHMDTFNNGFHMSDNEAASIRETAVWFPEWLQHQPLLSAVLGQAKMPLNKLASVLSSVEASFQLSERGPETDITGALTNLLSAVHDIKTASAK